MKIWRIERQFLAIKQNSERLWPHLKGLQRPPIPKLFSSSFSANIVVLNQNKVFPRISGVVCKFTCSSWNATYYGKALPNLKIKAGEDVGHCPLTGKSVLLSNCVLCRISHTRTWRLCESRQLKFDAFTVLAHKSSSFDLELKESLLIKRDTLPLNRNIRPMPLLLFDRA